MSPSSVSRPGNISETFHAVDTHLSAEGQGLVSRVSIEGLMKEQRSALFGLE
jgi:hypothetical protein